MNKGQILCLGDGQAGGILADTMKDKNKRYSTAYINSSLGDTKCLKYADIDTNVFIFNSADGSGRDRQKSKKYFKSDAVRLMSFLKGFEQFKLVNIFFSTDGGTGSGNIAELVIAISKVLPSIYINLVGILPKLNEQDLQLENSLDCIRDLQKVLHLINDVKFVNNNNMVNASYEEINELVVNDLDLSFSLVGHSSIGSIDESNLENVLTSQGYGVLLNLNPQYDINKAINMAKTESIFAIPDDLTSDYGAISIDSDLDIDRIISKLPVSKTFYKTTNDKGYNVVLLGRCCMPNDDISYIELELEERNKEKITLNRDKGFKLGAGVKKEQQTKQNKNVIDDEGIDDLFDSDIFDL